MRSVSTVLNAYLQLCRPLNAVMAGIGTLIGFWISSQRIFFGFDFGMAFLSVIFIISGGQAINDYFDREVDAKQKSNRPIASGKISPLHALLFAGALFIIGNLLALQLNSSTFLSFPIAFFFSALLVVYSAFMQKIKFLGNIIVAMGVGFTYIFGASIARITPLVLTIALAAFLANWAREIIKDVEDKEMDRGNKLTLPMIAASKHVHLLVGIILLATIFAGYIPSVWFGAGIIYTGIVTASNAIFILAGKKLIQNEPKKSASFMKMGMIAGLVAQLSLLLPLPL